MHTPPTHWPTASLVLIFLSRQVLIFVNTPEAGMRCRLFLEAFGLRAVLLSAELPLNSRHHILQARAGEGEGGGLRRAPGFWGVPPARPGVAAAPASYSTALPHFQEFNRGLFDYLIATDDVHGGCVAGGEGEDDLGSGSKRRRKHERGSGKRRRKGPAKDEEFGVTRGIDFKGVR